MMKLGFKTYKCTKITLWSSVSESGTVTWRQEKDDKAIQSSEATKGIIKHCSFSQTSETELNEAKWLLYCSLNKPEHQWSVVETDPGVLSFTFVILILNIWSLNLRYETSYWTTRLLKWSVVDNWSCSFHKSFIMEQHLMNFMHKSKQKLCILTPQAV